MSDEMVVGSVSWSPDFKSGPPPNKIQEMLDDGRIRLAPRWQGEKLVSVDLVKGDTPCTTDPVLHEEGPDLRPHQEEPKVVTLIGPCAETVEVGFTYTNWKGKTKERKAIFTSLQLGSTDYHPEPQLLFHGYDLDKKAPRTYAVKDISDIHLL